MPEITFDDLPEVIEENKLIASEIHMKVDQYLKNDHPKGWNKIDGAKRFIEQNHHGFGSVGPVPQRINALLY
ncbi:hypothetical protein QNH23_18450 [Siminovitchia fortis]|uniref:Uncharacterized protein n=1 Tax=Siminovitchia fortis TaxID=254758 RepID=A0A443IUV8_9BACI|nr:hypothetical protein [Siminovitchia fortis]RWR11899.1 hypothetical protein D4N35_008165 [Siminovitchia fortis]WHY81817.1 hypothetical protein QNH23_18450 [Siminovitchia fortis]